MKKKSYTTFAAIHLGSEMISMQIVEYRNMNKVKVIEQCNHRVKLGEETLKIKLSLSVWSAKSVNCCRATNA